MQVRKEIWRENEQRDPNNRFSFVKPEGKPNEILLRFGNENERNWQTSLSSPYDTSPRAEGTSILITITIIFIITIILTYVSLCLQYLLRSETIPHPSSPDLGLPW